MFSKDEFDFGWTHLIEHHIETRDAKPVTLPPKKIALAFDDEDQKELEKLKKGGAIQLSKSAWAKILVMVRKGDGSQGYVYDYRYLNAVMKDDAQ